MNSELKQMFKKNKGSETQGDTMYSTENKASGVKKKKKALF